MDRARRKDEHIYYSMCYAPQKADFSDVALIHNCLPDLNFNRINLETAYMGRTFRSPLFINAVTGGTKLGLRINALLAGVARRFGLPMAVGSQMAALESRASETSFKVVRRINPDGAIWANIGSYADPDLVLRAVKMIRADAVQIHLNAAQELIMSDGDRAFEGMVSRIEKIIKTAGVPVIVKEVGFGMAREQAALLCRAGVSAVDTGGRGGTNFLAIESRRAGVNLSPGLKTWGIPTAISIIEAASVLSGKTALFASGGIYDALDIAKALALGARAVGLAGYPLYCLLREGQSALVEKIENIETELRIIMMLTGAGTVTELQTRPLVITGYTAEWMKRRGLNPDLYARRPGDSN